MYLIHNIVIIQILLGKLSPEKNLCEEAKIWLNELECSMTSQNKAVNGQMLGCRIYCK